MENASPEVYCPKCKSTQISANKKGFSTGKAVAGAVITGGLVGAAAGAIGSNQIQITCLNCGHVFKPGDSQKQKEKEALIKKQEDFLNNANARTQAKKKFYKAYEAGKGDIELSELQTIDAGTAKYTTADEAYRKLKSADRAANVFGIIILVLVLVLAVSLVISK